MILLEHPLKMLGGTGLTVLSESPRSVWWRRRKPQEKAILCLLLLLQVIVATKTVLLTAAGLYAADVTDV